MGTHNIHLFGELRKILLLTVTSFKRHLKQVDKRIFQFSFQWVVE